MKVEEYDATMEKNILTGMIINDSVCGRVADKWKDDGLFNIRWTNLVGSWCVKYFRDYNKAPKNDIEGLFTAWVSQTTDEATIDLVDNFLGELNDDFEEEDEDLNPDYLIDIAAQHFNAVQLEKMSALALSHLKTGNVDTAMDTVTQWNKVEMGVGSGVDVLQDKTAILNAFEDAAEPLIKYPGALGKFFGSQFGRDEFVAFTGAFGRGKSWWLLDVAWQGMRSKKRVAFFAVGDMSQNQMMRRFMCRATGHPLKPPYDIDVPTAISIEPGQSTAEVTTETKHFKGPLQGEVAWKACEKRLKRNKKPLLRLSTHPNNSLNVAGIRSVLDGWERQDWIPDIIVIDYADVLAPMPGFQVGDREAINATWKELRGLSQIKHCLVVTATQADANSYDANTIGQSNFSDDRRKNDHATAMIGINVTAPEKENGVCRLNWTKRREDAFSESRCVHVAGCFAIGKVHIKATL